LIQKNAVRILSSMMKMQVFTNRIAKVLAWCQQRLLIYPKFFINFPGEEMWPAGRNE
jgi:hypothetical protein